MKLLTKAAGVAAQDASLPGPSSFSDEGFSFGACFAGLVATLHSVGIVAVYLAGGYGRD